MSAEDQAKQMAGLARHLRGELTGPRHPGWDEARSPWNLRARLVQVSGAYKPGPGVVADLRGTYTRWFLVSSRY